MSTWIWLVVVALAAIVGHAFGSFMRTEHHAEGCRCPMCSELDRRSRAQRLGYVPCAACGGSGLIHSPIAPESRPQGTES